MGVALRAKAVGFAICICVGAQTPAELRLCLHADPNTFDPLLAIDESSEIIRYLTAGTLIRFNRVSQRLEPELASSWTISQQGRSIDFVLRRGVRFSDGSLFGPADVVATVQRIMDPNLHSAIPDAFRSGGGEIKATQNGPDGVSVSFSRAVVGLEQRFDQLAISPSHPSRAGRVVLGPFMVADYKSGQYVLLQRNPNYWKTSESGGKLPRLDSIRLDIQTNRETELLRFRRGELQMIDKLEPEAFQRLRKESPSTTVNAGPSLDVEFFWFNQSPAAAIPAYKMKWFQSTRFRQAISMAVNRDDIIRIVYQGYASPAAGPISPANKQWCNTRLRPRKYDPEAALKLLRDDGFQFDGTTLRDREGAPVEFSLITNAGSKIRAQIGSMLQQDLKKIGILINFTPMEFQSLIERISKTRQYEACLLGLTNVEIDPASQTNIWLSSGTMHAWSPEQSKPITPWETEIDRLMKEQAAASTASERKNAFDRVQQIVYEQVPIIYLAHPDVLAAVSSLVRNVAPSALPPHLIWNIEYLSLAVAGNTRHE
jgi:peptide/nickel transport system substrate-binding protein